MSPSVTTANSETLFPETFRDEMLNIVTPLGQKMWPAQLPIVGFADIENELKSKKLEGKRVELIIRPSRDPTRGFPHELAQAQTVVREW